MSIHSVLTVSIAFPPKFDSEGLQVAKYFKYLGPACQDRLALDVVTSAQPTLYMNHDAALTESARDVRQTVEVRIYENKYANYLLRLACPVLANNPDTRFTFHWQWRSVVRRVQARPSLLYSRSFPLSSATMALKLQRHYRIPWILHLSDLWADSPDAEYSALTHRRMQAAEKEAFEAADVISVTSRKTIEFYRAKYPRLQKRYELFPNVYDPEDVPQRQPVSSTRGRRIRLVHTGGLAGTRLPAPFLAALEQVSPDAQARLDIVFAGWADRKAMAQMADCHCQSFSYLGPLPSYQDALELQSSADVLVLIDFPVSQADKRVFFLSKLLDYQIIGRPIMAITGKDSEVERYVLGEGGHCFEPEDTGGIQEYLEWLARCSDDEPGYFRLRPLHPEYCARHNAERLADLFAQLCHRA